MKEIRNRRPELFRGDSEERFNACVGLIGLGVEDKTVQRYLSIDSHMLRKWQKDANYKEMFSERLKQQGAKFASPTAQLERLETLKIDCGIRLLLHNKQTVRFMRDFSVFLDTALDAADAHGNGESTNGLEPVEDAKRLTLEKAIKTAAAHKRLTVDLNALEQGIKTAANNVDLDANDFLNALIERLRASNSTQQ